MIVYIVTHKCVDLDAALSAAIMRYLILNQEKVLGRTLVHNVEKVHLVFLPNGQSFRGEGFNDLVFKELTDESSVVIYVDFEAEDLYLLFDENNPRWKGEVKSSLGAIVEYFGLRKRMPEWNRIFRLIDLADKGKLDEMQQGWPNYWHELIGMRLRGCSDLEITEKFWETFQNLAANEEAWRDINKLRCKKVDTFFPLPSERIWVGVKELGGGLELGFIQGPILLWGKLRSFLTNVPIFILWDPEMDHFAVNANLGLDGMCLRRLGILRALREKEAKLRGLELSVEVLSRDRNVPGMALYGFVPAGDSRIGSVMHGSQKIQIPLRLKHKIPLEDVVRIVERCWLESIASTVGNLVSAMKLD